ncbi:hypothetical protein SJAG_04685 [Schizosaccharomyces japonicus yFS275]|uniref:Uncharacterized protein n=1 Tax=Schizosaccharomyces japonicus (strain yFS275 / FY16936) TaxID=402676 RepID=B6K7H3_SCHJY|nr:hypothetical protein SJAG_04685 [Schizosaccharomyces japonicus yFS275]EEB09477.2 hypothetical protein SJAG_04685 [Schizosaccharomyces japonicus yFS275]
MRLLVFLLLPLLSPVWGSIVCRDSVFDRSSLTHSFTEAACSGASVEKRSSFSSSSSPSSSSIRSPLLTQLQMPAPKRSLASPVFHMLNWSVNYETGAKDAVGSEFVESIDAVLQYANTLVSRVFFLNQTISIRVTVLNSSTIPSTKRDSTSYSTSLSTPVASAQPARLLPLLDDDGLVRYYPQSVVKQFSLNTNGADVSFAEYDVEMYIYPHSNLYYDTGDNSTTIQSNQVDLLHVVLHELMHGLGFLSSWSEYMGSSSSAITPTLVVQSTTSGGSTTYRVGGVLEYEFDRNVHFESELSQGSSNLTRSMEEYVQSDSAPTESNANDVYTALASSELTQLGNTMLQYATTPYSLGMHSAGATASQLAANSSHVFLLETSFSTFACGSSLSHMAADVYDGTPDFLMRYVVTAGISMQDMLERAYKTTSEHGARDRYGPFGPALRETMRGMGYRIFEYTDLNEATASSSAAVSIPTVTPIALVNSLSTSNTYHSVTPTPTLTLFTTVTTVIVEKQNRATLFSVDSANKTTSRVVYFASSASPSAFLPSRRTLLTMSLSTTSILLICILRH